MQTIYEFVDLPALCMLVAANSVPVILTRLLGTRGAAPIDGNRALRDGRPMFGPHKTWRGLISGIAAAALAGALLSRGFGTGALFGALALAGDLLSSFLKRRLGSSSGHSIPLLDQLPEAILPMVVLSGPLALHTPAIIGTAIVFTVLDLLTARFRP